MVSGPGLWIGAPSVVVVPVLGLFLADVHILELVAAEHVDVHDRVEVLEGGYPEPASSEMDANE